MSALPKVAGQRETWARLQSDPDQLFDHIMTAISCGGTLVGLSKMWAIPYPWVSRYVRADPAIYRAYQEALSDRREYLTDSLLVALRNITSTNIAELFNEDGSMIPPHLWPEDLAVAVSAIEIDELFEGAGRERTQIGHTKRVKFWDKLKALEMVAKHVNFSVDKVEHSGVVTLEKMIIDSMIEKDKPK
jgi:hypothetical protein